MLTTPEKHLNSAILFVECLSVNREREKIKRYISMNLDTVHVAQRFHHGLKSSYFVMKITEGSACMDCHL